MSKKTKLLGGPGDGIFIAGGDKQNFLLPLDKNLNPLKTKDEPYALALYRLATTGNYEFHTAKRKEAEKPFDVEFIDGPMNGIHPFAQAIQLYDSIFRIPLDAEHRPLEQGAKVAAVAEYKREQINGVWKMAFVRIVDNPKEVENGADVIAEHQLVQELQVYTTEQLVNELLSRQRFFGVILMYPDELVGEGRLEIKKGASFVIGMGKQLNADKAKIILSSAITSLEEQ